MSIRATLAAAATPAPSHAAKLVMFVLACHHNHETGACYPSRRRLAVQTGLNITSIDRAIKELVEAKLIRKRGATKRGGNPFEMSNRYDLDFITNAPGEQQDLFPVLEGTAQKGGGATPPKRESNPSSLRSEETRAKPKAKRKRSQQRAPRRRIDTNWMPDKKDRAFAEAQGFDGPSVEVMAQDFVDFWLAEGETKASWSATWHRWVRKRATAKETGNGSRSGSSPRRGPTARVDAIRGFDAAVRQGGDGGE